MQTWSLYDFHVSLHLFKRDVGEQRYQFRFQCFYPDPFHAPGSPFMRLCMIPVISGKTPGTVHRLIGTEIPCNEIPEPRAGTRVAPEEDGPPVWRCYHPDVPRVALAATAGAAGYPHLDFCRECLV